MQLSDMHNSARACVAWTGWWEAMQTVWGEIQPPTFNYFKRVVNGLQTIKFDFGVSHEQKVCDLCVYLDAIISLGSRASAAEREDARRAKARHVQRADSERKATTDRSTRCRTNPRLMVILQFDHAKCIALPFRKPFSAVLHEVPKVWMIFFSLFNIGLREKRICTTHLNLNKGGSFIATLLFNELLAGIDRFTQLEQSVPKVTGQHACVKRSFAIEFHPSGLVLSSGRGRREQMQGRLPCTRVHAPAGLL